MLLLLIIILLLCGGGGWRYGLNAVVQAVGSVQPVQPQV